MWFAAAFLTACDSVTFQYPAGNASPLNYELDGSWVARKGNTEPVTFHLLSDSSLYGARYAITGAEDTLFQMQSGQAIFIEGSQGEIYVSVSGFTRAGETSYDVPDGKYMLLRCKLDKQRSTMTLMPCNPDFWKNAIQEKRIAGQSNEADNERAVAFITAKPAEIAKLLANSDPCEAFDCKEKAVYRRISRE